MEPVIVLGYENTGSPVMLMKYPPEAATSDIETTSGLAVLSSLSS